MSDEHMERTPGVFDDDRLLAYALGLDDDRELEQAAAADAGLRLRLDAMLADVAAVRDGVSAAAPAPDEGYTDLGDARWAGLGEFLQPPAPRRRRGSFWLRVLAPVAIVAVAAAVGLTVITHQNGSGSSFSSAGSSEVGKTAPAPVSGLGAPTASGTAAPAAAPALDLSAQSRRYAVVVVARARAVHGTTQSFRIVRRLKSRATWNPRVITLRVTSAPAKVGALHVLFLEPLPATPAPAPSSVPSTSPLPTPGGAVTSSAGASPPATPDATSPSVLPSPVVTPQTAPELAFTYQGQAAMAQQLPAGTDAASVQLP